MSPIYYIHIQRPFLIIITQSALANAREISAVSGGQCGNNDLGSGFYHHPIDNSDLQFAQRIRFHNISSPQKRDKNGRLTELGNQTYTHAVCVT